jgi:hypothetical protein
MYTLLVSDTAQYPPPTCSHSLTHSKFSCSSPAPPPFAQISWVKSERRSTELLSTNVVNPGTNEKMPLYSTPEPTTQEQEVVFDYTRFADVEAYGLISGKTRLDDGGLFVGTKP